MSGIKETVKAMLPNTLKYQLKVGLNFYYNRCMLKRYETLLHFINSDFPMGINLIGDIKAETGLGQSMRILAGILDKNEIPFVIIQVNQPGGLERNQDSWDYKIEAEPKYAVNLIHINASEWAESYIRFSKEILEGRYNIAYWLWELETFPKQWTPCMQTVDEIWAPSEFICDCLRNYTDKTVLKVPYSIELALPVQYGRAHFHLPEDVFLYLVMYDFKSISERKNPKGMIRAFKQAFSPKEANDGKIGLVVKVNHVENRQELHELQLELEQYEFINYITENLDRSEVESLVSAVDVYVSLHRSEGFGLPAAEAMYMGTPVIATNWSATTEFMSEKNACLVDYKMVSLNRQLGPYPKGSRWADADIEQAAGYMKKLYYDRAYYYAICEEAKQSIRQQLNSKTVGQIIRQQLGKIDNISH